MNAKEELLKELEKANKSLEDVIAYNICLDTWKNNIPSKITVRIKGTKLTEEELSSLDIKYDMRYQGQVLLGTVLFKDDTWFERGFERGECEGSEGWVYMYPPTVEQVLGSIR
jgi:hypothetical protein